MALYVKSGGVLREITALSVKTGGVVRKLRTLQAMVDGELKTIANFIPPLSASASGSAEGIAGGNTPVFVTSNPVTATPTGGQAPFSYSWAIVSGDTGITIVAPTSASTAFRKALFNATASATARCTITDALGTTATCDVSVFLEQSSGVA